MSYRLERFTQYETPVRVERKPTGQIIAETLIVFGVLYIIGHWIIKWVG